MGLGFDICPHSPFCIIVVTSSTMAVRSPQMAHAGLQGQAFVWAWVCVALFKNRVCLLEIKKEKHHEKYIKSNRLR